MYGKTGEVRTSFMRLSGERRQRILQHLLRRIGQNSGYRLQMRSSFVRPSGSNPGIVTQGESRS